MRRPVDSLLALTEGPWTVAGGRARILEDLGAGSGGHCAALHCTALHRLLKSGQGYLYVVATVRTACRIQRLAGEERGSGVTSIQIETGAQLVKLMGAPLLYCMSSNTSSSGTRTDDRPSVLAVFKVSVDSCSAKIGLLGPWIDGGSCKAKLGENLKSAPLTCT